jgi:hypothetical protein
MPIILNRRKFITGLALLVSFGVTLAVFLSPVFGGATGLQVVDGIFNSLSKGSAYYIPELQREADRFAGVPVELVYRPKSAGELEKAFVLFSSAGAAAVKDNGGIRVSGDLALLAKNALADADSLFKAGREVPVSRYGFSQKEAVYYWWAAFRQIRSVCLQENRAAEAVYAENVTIKALEPAYNYAGIPAARFAEVKGISIGSLLFYIVYTIWYGLAIMLIFESLGITASKPAQKQEA